MWTRRQLLRTGALGFAALPWVRRARADVASERKFLFVLAYGGWDTTYVFSPMLGNPEIDGDPESTQAEAGGITFADAESRPMVRRFFETYGGRTCVVNGLQVRSLAHSVCLRDIMTGTLQQTDDWPAILAGGGATGLLLPMVHLSGPSYTDAFGGQVIRVGSAGQLPSLLAGARSSAVVEGLEDAYASARAEAAVARAGAGRAQALAAQALQAEERLGRLQALGAEVDLAAGETLAERGATIAELFERGLARCGIVQHDGHRDIGWDTHGGNNSQSEHFEDLFTGLSAILADLGARAGTGEGASLADETTVVVLSEMNRFPRLNGREGKDHWPHTSAMLIGAGVRGGQVIGAYDDDFVGRPVDLVSGETVESGTRLGPGNLGATLLQLGGIDPAIHIGDATAIEAAIR